MNANNIYSGEQYAWVRYRSRGKFPTNARKVEVESVRKYRHPGDTNAKTYVTIIDEDGRKHETDARNIIDFWHNYEGEVARIKAEKEERERKWREEEAERLAKAERERKTKERRDTMLKEALAVRGFPMPVQIKKFYGATPDQLVFDRIDIENWLGLDAVPAYTNPTVSEEWHNANA